MFSQGSSRESRSWINNLVNIVLAVFPSSSISSQALGPATFYSNFQRQLSTSNKKAPHVDFGSLEENLRVISFYSFPSIQFRYSSSESCLSPAPVPLRRAGTEPCARARVRTWTRTAQLFLVSWDLTPGRGQHTTLCAGHTCPCVFPVCIAHTSA